MSSANSVNPLVQSYLTGNSSGLVRIPPEPRSRIGFDFSSILQGISGLASAAIGTQTGGIQPQYLALINKQIEMQEQMQLVSLTSNIEKSRHESRMAAVRNVRAG
ncbi:MAG: hypothetical protein KDD60_04180 [Bdellovibrionales bacterium]|nr:hypothetical protein [Bdellovibrionales bacterium]